MIKNRKKFLITTSLLILGLWINNTSLFINTKDSTPKLLAHRGLGQTFDVSKVEWDTDTSKIIYPPEHKYLENTIPSMRSAFMYGADIVELDIQKTKDNKLAVFHDFDLAMRTNGSNSTRDYTMDELKKLDIGYGYTHDNGKTYPFRNTGFGLMPELKEVLEIFTNHRLSIDVKDGDLETTKILWTYLKDIPDEKLSLFTIYTSDEGINYLRNQNSDIRVLSKSSLKKALIKYELLGWTGYIPKEIHNMEIRLPLKYAKFLWGWPHKFVNRMEKVNTNVVIVNGNGKWSEGFDNINDLNNIPKGYNGYIWTNRIDKIGTIFKSIQYDDTYTSKLD